MTTTLTCPAVETLARLVLGQLPELEARAARDHAIGCPRCAVFIGGRPAPATSVAGPAHGLLPTAIELPAVAAHPFLRPPQRSDELGRLGVYRVLEELGRGGMGIVFRAEDPSLGRTVALKVMKPEFVTDASARERFTREARAVGALAHVNVVTIYQVGEDNGLPFLAMQFLQGETLADRLDRERRLSIPESLRIGREIVEGLAAAHAAGLIHRDIKPANIWLESARSAERGARSENHEGRGSDGNTELRALHSALGRVKILDFGLARSAEDTHLTRTGTVVGTPAYMSPEQAAGKPLGPRSDLFSLGSVLYDMCTGRPPFDAPDEMAMMIAVATQRPRPVTELNPDVPELMVRLLLRLLAKHPDDRPLSAAQVIDMFRLIEQTLEPIPEEIAHQIAAKSRSSGGGLTAVLAVVVALGAIAGYVFRDELRALLDPVKPTPQIAPARATTGSRG